MSKDENKKVIKSENPNDLVNITVTEDYDYPLNRDQTIAFKAGVIAKGFPRHVGEGMEKLGKGKIT